MIGTENKNNLNEDTKRMLGNIMVNSKRMGTLIDDLLNFSRLGRKDPVTHVTDMEPIVNEIVEDQKNHFAPIKYTIQIHDLPTCLCDSSLIKQVWENLISNAFKYSSNNPSP